MLVVGEVIAGRYELEELVGTGGMSSVFRARDRLLERRVALKVLHEHYTDDEGYVERFRREARVVAQLSHPNIVTVIDRGEDEGRQFIVFELVEGRTLKDLLEEEGRLPVRPALEIALQVARGLAFAHEHGLVHRDVKPQNVILNGDGRAKVTDFGIARSRDIQGVTQTGMVLGTSNYVAPEQAQGGKVDRATDVYSLGVVLFELLTGEVPFPGESFVAVAMRHVSEPPPSVLERRPDVPARVAHAVDLAALGLLGGDVVRGAEHRARLRRAPLDVERAGNAEVGHLGAPVAVQDDVLRLDVTVDEPVLVREGEAAGDLERDLERAPDRQPPLLVQDLLERPPLDQLEDDELPALVLAAVDDGDDVRMRQLRHCARLAAEALDVLVVVRVVLVQDLERDLPLEQRVVRPEDARHATCADELLELVAPGDDLPHHRLDFPERPSR